MMNPWIATSNRLPRQGDALLFVVEQRDIVLSGTYSSCMFKSRWSCYSPADVTEWKLLDVRSTGESRDAQPPSGETLPTPAQAA